MLGRLGLAGRLAAILLLALLAVTALWAGLAYVGQHRRTGDMQEVRLPERIAAIVDLVAAPSRARAFGVFYTLTVGAGAIAPFAYGLLSDAIGIERTLQTAAGVVLLTLPATLLLRRPFRAAA